MKAKRKKGHVKLPLLWVAGAWLWMIILGIALFKFLLYKQGVSFPIAAGQSTDPYFFAGMAAVVVPFFLIVYVFKVMRGIIEKRSALEIAKDVGKDIAVAAAETVIDAFSSGGGSKSGSTASGSDLRGGGGQSGGAGSSGGY